MFDPEGVLINGCALIEHMKIYITQFASGDCVYSKQQAQKGVLKKIIIKKQKVTGNGQFSTIYTDTLNSVWDCDDIVTKSRAITLAKRYYENQKNISQLQAQY